MMMSEPLLRFAANEVSADEDEGTMTFTVNVLKVVGEGDEARLEATTSGKPISADIFSVDHRGEADRDADYTLASNMLTIPAGAESGTITINLDNRDAKEDNERFTLLVRNPVNATFGSGFPYLSGEGTIEDVDGPPNIATVMIERVGPMQIQEGETAVFTVSAVGPIPAQGLPVNINTSDGTSDVIAGTPLPTVTIPMDTRQVRYEVMTSADTVDEPTGTITVSITPDSSYAVEMRNSATVDVLDDDAAAGAPVITISGDSTEVYEGDDAVFTLSASPAPTGDAVSQRSL